MRYFFLSLAVSGFLFSIVFLIIWVILAILKKNRTFASVGIKVNLILFIVGFSLAIGIGFAIVFWGLIALIWHLLHKNKKKIAESDQASSTSSKPKLTFFTKPSIPELKIGAVLLK